MSAYCVANFQVFELANLDIHVVYLFHSIVYTKRILFMMCLDYIEPNKSM